MTNYSPGNEDLCFTCHLMQECTDTGKLPPCLGVIEPVQQTTDSAMVLCKYTLCSSMLCGADSETREKCNNGPFCHKLDGFARPANSEDSGTQPTVSNIVNTFQLYRINEISLLIDGLADKISLPIGVNGKNYLQRTLRGFAEQLRKMR